MVKVNEIEYMSRNSAAFGEIHNPRFSEVVSSQPFGGQVWPSLGEANVAIGSRGFATKAPQ